MTIMKLRFTYGSAVRPTPREEGLLAEIRKAKSGGDLLSVVSRNDVMLFSQEEQRAFMKKGEDLMISMFEWMRIRALIESIDCPLERLIWDKIAQLSK